MMMPGMEAAAGAEGGAAQDSNKIVDLLDFVEKKSCYARNEDPRFPHSNLFIGDSRLGCKSDADEQLILHIEFNQFVKIHSLKFTAFNQGNEPETSPTVVKLYINRPNLGFEDIDDVDETQALELTSEDLREGSDAMLLKFVKFQRVSSLTIFIEDNNGGDVSSLGGLKLYGKTVATTNMCDFKKNKG
ncbi:unnamed protein product [Cylindrotheca closterium]|uniref:PITH domain-containing protein n=1 Tax=Cylindrotheca closterium TaxID=2856 RepID=A0AAD2JN39_9STRA|nr:unnamed protein product [Cylindrotheca closterium]